MNHLVFYDTGHNFIVAGYCLLWLSPDSPYEEVVNRALGGVLLTTVGGVMLIVWLHRRSR